VVDASIALAWCFPDEAGEYADVVLDALEGRTMLVPTIWPLEIVNALQVGERRKRIRRPDSQRFVELLKGLNIFLDTQPWADTISNVLPLAREHNLSAYDAAYLDLAVRQAAPLATLDAGLKKATFAAHIEIFQT